MLWKALCSKFPSMLSLSVVLRYQNFEIHLTRFNPCYIDANYTIVNTNFISLSDIIFNSIELVLVFGARSLPGSFDVRESFVFLLGQLFHQFLVSLCTLFFSSRFSTLLLFNFLILVITSVSTLLRSYPVFFLRFSNYPNFWRFGRLR